jgi:hypothetical protein
MLVRRLVSQGALNSPWGLALAPAGFGRFGGALLVGNNGDGRINAFDPTSGAFLGPLTDDNGMPIIIPSLWALTFGNDHEGGAADTLFFTAGVDSEQHGLFGAIQAPQRRGADTGGSGTFDPHVPGEPGDYPLPPSGGPALRQGDEDLRLTTAVLLPMAESSLALVPTLVTVSPPGARVEAPASAALLVTVSLQGPAGTALVVSSTIPFSPPPDDPPPPTHTDNNTLSLNTFLDLSAAPTQPENPTRVQQSDINGNAIGARRPPAAGSEAGAESLPAEPHIEILEAWLGAEQGPESQPPSDSAAQVVPRGPSENRPELAGDRSAGSEGVETHPRGSWKNLLNGLLVAVSIPVIWALCKGPNACQVSHLRKRWLSWFTVGYLELFRNNNWPTPPWHKKRSKRGRESFNT